MARFSSQTHWSARRTIFAVLLATIALTPTLGQTPPDSSIAQILKTISDDVSKLSDNGQTRIIKSDIQSSVSLLGKVGTGKEAPIEYLYSIRMDHAAIKKYIDIEASFWNWIRPIESGITILKQGAADLRTKATFAESNPTRPFEKVLLKVQTKTPTGPKPGLLIWYVVAGEVHLSDGARFDHLTPTSQELVVGNYYLSTDKNRRNPPPYTIGNNTTIENGKIVQELELLVH